MWKYLLWTPLLIISACIGDDLVFDEVAEVLRITNAVDSLQVGTSYQFEITFLNNVGVASMLNDYEWSTSDPEVITIDENGLATAIAIGTASIRVSSTSATGLVLEDQNDIVVSNSETVVSTSGGEGKLVSSSSYVLTGTFALTKSGTGVTLSFEDDYEATDALPGLYIYLSNNPKSTSGALEIGAVTVFKGAHDYGIDDVGVEDYSHVLYFCKPFSVKVGDGRIDN